MKVFPLLVVFVVLLSDNIWCRIVSNHKRHHVHHKKVRKIAHHKRYVPHSTHKSVETGTGRSHVPKPHTDSGEQMAYPTPSLIWAVRRAKLNNNTEGVVTGKTLRLQPSKTMRGTARMTVFDDDVENTPVIIDSPLPEMKIEDITVNQKKDDGTQPAVDPNPEYPQSAVNPHPEISQAAVSPNPESPAQPTADPYPEKEILPVESNSYETKIDQKDSESEYRVTTPSAVLKESEAQQVKEPEAQQVKESEAQQEQVATQPASLRNLTQTLNMYGLTSSSEINETPASTHHKAESETVHKKTIKQSSVHVNYPKPIIIGFHQKPVHRLINSTAREPELDNPELNSLKITNHSLAVDGTDGAEDKTAFTRHNLKQEAVEENKAGLHYEDVDQLDSGELKNRATEPQQPQKKPSQTVINHLKAINAVDKQNNKIADLVKQNGLGDLSQPMIPGELPNKLAEQIFAKNDEMMKLGESLFDGEKSPPKIAKNQNNSILSTVMNANRMSTPTVVNANRMSTQNNVAKTGGGSLVNQVMQGYQSSLPVAAVNIASQFTGTPVDNLNNINSYRPVVNTGTNAAGVVPGIAPVSNIPYYNTAAFTQQIPIQGPPEVNTQPAAANSYTPVANTLNGENVNMQNPSALVNSYVKSPSSSSSPSASSNDNQKLNNNKIQTIVKQSGAAPQLTGTVPKQSGAAPKQSGTAPKLTGTVPKQSGAAPKQSGTAPQLTGTVPKQSGAAPKQSGAAPKLTGTAPKQTGTVPKLIGAAPKQTSMLQKQAGTFTSYQMRPALVNARQQQALSLPYQTLPTASQTNLLKSNVNKQAAMKYNNKNLNKPHGPSIAFMDTIFQDQKSSYVKTKSSGKATATGNAAALSTSDATAQVNNEKSSSHTQKIAGLKEKVQALRHNTARKQGSRNSYGWGQGQGFGYGKTSYGRGGGHAWASDNYDTAPYGNYGVPGNNGGPKQQNAQNPGTGEVPAQPQSSNTAPQSGTSTSVQQQQQPQQSESASSQTVTAPQAGAAVSAAPQYTDNRPKPIVAKKPSKQIQLTKVEDESIEDEVEIMDKTKAVPGKKLEQKIQNKLEKPKGKHFAEQATGSGYGKGFGNKESWGQGGGYAWAGKAPPQGAPNPADFVQKSPSIAGFPLGKGYSSGSGGYSNSGGVQSTGGPASADSNQPAAAAAQTPQSGGAAPQQQPQQQPQASVTPSNFQNPPLTLATQGNAVMQNNQQQKIDYKEQDSSSNEKGNEEGRVKPRIEEKVVKTPNNKTVVKPQPKQQNPLASKYDDDDK